MVGCGAPREAGKALCFVVSGACHAGPLLCAGVALKWQLSMMAFFLLQVGRLLLHWGCVLTRTGRGGRVR